MNKEKGIWLPDEILKDKRLDLSTKAVLSVYKYYTIEGELHCCMLTNEQIGDMIGISIPTVQRAKRQLKELGLIKSDGGIKVWYMGYQNDTHNNSDENKTQITDNQNEEQNNVLPNTNTNGRGIIMTPQGYQNDTHPHQNDTHNKDIIKKEKKENKSTIEQMSNTSDISTSKGDDVDDEDLEYMEQYGISKLSYILQRNDDWIPALEYLTKHPTKSNYNKIEAYWSDNDEYLECLHNLNNNSLRITV